MTVIDITDRINYRTNSAEILIDSIKLFDTIYYTPTTTAEVIDFEKRITEINRKMSIINEKIKELIDDK